MTTQQPSEAYPSLLDIGLYLTMHGYNWYWLAFVCMLSSLLATIVLDLMVSTARRPGTPCELAKTVLAASLVR